MSGFNRITQVQPARSTPTITPLGARLNNQNTLNIQRNSQQQQQVRTPMKRPQPVEVSTPAKRPQSIETYRSASQAFSGSSSFATPANKMPPPSHHNAPLKKRSVESVQSRPQDDSFVAAAIIEESDAFLDDSQGEVIQNIEEEMEHVGDYDAFPANQQGLFDTGYELTPPEDSNKENGERVAFERVKEETVEMGGFILPGSEKKETRKSYNWLAGRSDGQYRVVLGYNTLFKPKSKNSIDVTTGEKDSNRWRVVRFENRYKENYPYTEFPAKYLGPIIQALEKAHETHEQEIKEDSVL
jgi:co-chaperonin GroES (HSP10)